MENTPTNEIAISVEGLSKTFKLPHEKQNSVKSLFVNLFKGRRSYENQRVLKNVSFDIKKGEFFGIVGRNGSGKSTLLKILAGIYAPNRGEVKINGKLTPFIELGVGFNPELTGRENVYLNGALLGIGRKEMNGLYNEIVEFAELEKFMDQKLKNYSSGMQVRLAFSIAIRAPGEILLLDEVLAVGDAAFQQKCYDYFHSLKEEDKTIILVSHSMTTVEQFCDRALLIEQGEIKYIGSSERAAELYEQMFRAEEVAKLKAHGENAFMDPIVIKSVEVHQNGNKVTDVKAKKPFELILKIESKMDYSHVNFGFNIKNHDKVLLISSDTDQISQDSISLRKGKVVTATFTIQNILTNGVYTVSVGVADSSQSVHKLISKQEAVIRFSVSGLSRHTRTLTHPNIKGEITGNKT